MKFELPSLNYKLESLSPVFSQETMEYHYLKHHKGYVDKLNLLIQGSIYEQMSLSQILLTPQKPTDAILANAAQHWNHSFFWECLSPNSNKPSVELLSKINSAFGSLEEFKQQFSASAMSVFGSGWTWLVLTKEGNLAIKSTSNAGNPMMSNEQALLTCDVWEHAYYIDYRNQRNRYLEAFWDIVSWDFIDKMIKS